MVRIFTYILVSSFSLIGYTQSGLIVNEFSNGASGSKEFMEFLVVGTPCTTVDLRGWIFDDNNGPDDTTCEGFSTQYGSAGIAPGHIRFKYDSQWSAIPVGSIILVYNSADKNTSITQSDDPTDINNDKVYIIPIDYSGLEVNTTVPTSSGICSYSGANYSNTSGSSWNQIGLRNSGDACQTRRPDGSYFHGFAYGTTSNNMTGGPDNLWFNESGTGRCYFLNCGHYSFISDYSSDSYTSETPGAANNALNQTYIDYYQANNGCGVKDACVTLLASNNILLKGKNEGNKNKISWIVDDDSNTEKYIIERSTNKLNFSHIFSINSSSSQSYDFEDELQSQQDFYYQVTLITKSGERLKSNIIFLSHKSSDSFSTSSLYPNPTKEFLSFDLNIEKRGKIISCDIYDSLGKKISSNNYTKSESIIIQTSNWTNGIYYLVIITDDQKETVKFTVNH